MRKPIIAGNWKMYKTAAETAAFFEKFNPLVAQSTHCEIVICPTFVNLPAAAGAAKGTRIGIGGQNLYFVKEGAYTGEVSGPMLAAVGAQWVIIGHSERRQYFGETDASVLKKTVAALEAGLNPIVCVGERLEEREAGKTATPEIAADAHRVIREQAAKQFGKGAADDVRILYGGSVKPDNIKGLMAQPEIDGGLVGGASLDPVSFANIV